MSDESRLATFPLRGAQNGDADVAGQPMGGNVGLGTDFGDVRISDHHQIDFLGQWTWLAQVAAGPGAVDQSAVDSVDAA